MTQSAKVRVHHQVTEILLHRPLRRLVSDAHSQARAPVSQVGAGCRNRSRDGSGIGGWGGGAADEYPLE